MKRIMMLAVCVASLTVLAGEYDDYVKYTGSGTVSAFDNGAYWDDNGNPPGPGKKYYIGKSYYYGWNGETGKTFQGDKLVVANTFFFWRKFCHDGRFRRHRVDCRLEDLLLHAVADHGRQVDGLDNVRQSAEDRVFTQRPGV